MRKSTNNAVLWLMANNKAVRELAGDLGRGATDAEREVMRRSLARGDRRMTGRQ
jgi:hypothetical protein